MAKTFNAIEATKKLIDSFSEKDLTTAQTKLAETTNIGSAVLERIRIPIITSNEDVAEYVNQFELSKPENFVRYLVEASYAPVESICNGINAIREENLDRYINGVKTCTNNYLIQLEDPKKILAQLEGIANNLESMISRYINAIKSIDNRSKWRFFIGAKSALTEIDSNVSLAKSAVASYVRASNLYIIIASQCGVNSQTRLNSYENFMDNILLSNGVCRLMHEYDVNQDDEFWLKMTELKEQAFVISEISNNMAESEEFDMENIDFS